MRINILSRTVPPGQVHVTSEQVREDAAGLRLAPEYLDALCASRRHVRHGEEQDQATGREGAVRGEGPKGQRSGDAGQGEREQREGGLCRY